MARRYYVDLSDTIASWRAKTNLLSWNIGDLDNLEFDEDSDVVAALNSLHRQLNQGVDTETRDSRLLIKDASGTILKTIHGFSDSGG